MRLFFGKMTAPSKSGNTAHLVYSLSFMLLNLVQRNSCQNITLGLLVPYQGTPAFGDDFYSGKFYASAIQIAIDDINSNPTLLPGKTVDFIWNDTRCKTGGSIQAQAYQWTQGVDAFIGPGCTCETEAHFAAAFNTPMISYMCSNEKVSDKSKYPTFARTFIADRQVPPSVLAVLRYYKWSRVAIIAEELERWQKLTEYMKEYFKKNDVEVATVRTIPPLTKYDYKVHSLVYKEIFRHIKTTARIVILACSRYIAREGMVYAAQEGLQHGEYSFIMFEFSAEIVKNNQKHQFKWFIGGFLETISLTLEEKKAYRSALLLAIKPATAESYTNFTENLKTRIAGPPFYSKEYQGVVLGYNKSLTDPPVFGAYLYDSVYQYAVGLNRTLNQGESIKNGTNIIGNLLNRQYTSILGYELLMDSKGDVHMNLTLNDYRSSGPEGFVEVGQFQVKYTKSDNGSSNGSTIQSEQILVLHENNTIIWPAGTAPLDRPKCGFDNQFCRDDQEEQDTTLIIVGAVLGFLVIIIGVMCVILYRKHKLEKELASLLWKIDYNDIQMISRAKGSMRSQVMRSQISLESRNSDVHEQLYTRIGIYKSTTVAIKKVTTEINRKIQMELKQMRDLRHDNLNAFIGACVDPPDICIISQYCSKGSLQDILENEDVKLDSMFITSLASDIVKGMAHLHGSEIRSHGSLKSSNCLIDSRWVLKIADYGLAQLKKEESENSYAYYFDLLWRAPELLRMDSPPPVGTQKGDIYSFAIILQEIHTRTGPYDIYVTLQEPRELVEKLKMRCDVPFRLKVQPMSELEDLKTVMEMCWDENPEKRPEFSEIKKMLRKLNKGRNTNILDNMVYMLEKYANNLESLVEERTLQLVEEKKKTEALLHQMLPPTVATDLKQGKPVQAENFDEVSIFFSDIVGFTTLSSISTPFQVVDLLNDLYTLFDDIINEYDVYKVETIGDAYMVVSGLPIRNGHHHAGEIADMALHMLSEISSFRIRHRPEEKLKLRIGVHSGPVCAGVVGNKMPRYCLFGDTVNTASRLESNGEALKIHISGLTKALLEMIGGYIIEDRGIVTMKGKGAQTTYWLVGSDRKRNNLRSPKPLSTPQLSGRRGKRQLIRQASKKIYVNSRTPETRSYGDLNGEVSNIPPVKECKVQINWPENDLNKKTPGGNSENSSVNNNLPQINA